MGDSPDSAKSDPYRLDPPAEQEPPAPPRPAVPPRAAPPREVDEPSPIKALDICPNCGSPMGPVDTVVCLRCGYDLKTLKVIHTKTEPQHAIPAPVEEAVEETEPLCRPGIGDLWLPALLGGVCLLVLIVGCLAGAKGLMGGAAEPASILVRFNALLRVVLRTAILAAAGLGGLWMLAHIMRAPFGNLKLAAVRMAGIMAILGLPAFISTTSRALEWTLESLVQGFAYVGLAMLFFRLALRDAMTLLGVTVMAVLVLLLVSGLLQWATPPL